MGQVLTNSLLSFFPGSQFFSWYLNSLLTLINLWRTEDGVLDADRKKTKILLNKHMYGKSATFWEKDERVKEKKIVRNVFRKKKEKNEKDYIY